MTRSNTNYRTAMVALTAGDSIREAHSYEYDNNGNIVYVNTSRVKPGMTTQPDTVQRGREERFRWDEENRLTALSQNGYVSHYWYDADGERKVKMHGGNQAVFVNGRQDGRVLDTQQTTAYFSPCFSIQGNSFTKHLYIGSERIASMTGTLSPGDVSNSSAGGYNISHAGYNVGVTQLNIPYATKLTAMSDSAEANYAYFDLPNAFEGQTRQALEFVLPAEDSDNAGNSVSSNSGDGRGDASYNGNIWFIHADHLGSSTLVTDGNGGVSQQIEYLPYGEVFLEGQAGNYGTPFKFNGKELDEETGLYYYGARYMNPRLSIWYGTDKLQESYYGISSYCYSLGSPNNNIDLDGKLTLFVNGYYNTRNNLITRYMIGNSSGTDYWNPFFIKAAQSFFSDGNVMYVDGRGTYNSSGKDRFNAGYLYAHTLYHSIKSKMKDGERINVVSHSMGSAYSEGIISYLMKQGMEMGTIVHLSPADPSEFSAHAPNTLQMQINNDAVLGYKNFGENSIIEGVNRYGIIKTSDSFFDDLISSHGRTKLDKNIWDYVKSLSEMKMHFLKQKTTYISIGPPNFPNYVPVTYNYYNSINTNGAIFNQVMINGKVYIYDSKDHYKSLE